MKNRFFILTAAAVLTAFLVILAGCPAPLEPGKLALLQDLNAPRIIVTSPQDYGEYATIIELEGYIEDESIGSLPDDAELTVSYSIPGSSISGTASVDPASGIFSAVINASELHGDQVIELSSADINGNTADAAVNIRKPEDGGDISGFTVTPANKQVTISWDPVPGAVSYSIFESRYGHTVESNEIAGTEYTWTGLTNGEKYTFRLTAHLRTGFGDDAISAEVTKMPLSTRSLAPWVKETGYKSITIEWRENPNVEDYVVERSLSPKGPWEVRRNLTEHEFTDTEVEHDTTYYYRVTPSEFDDVVSEYTDGVPGRFGDSCIGNFDSKNYYNDIEIENGFAYIAADGEGLFIIDISNPEAPFLTGSLSTTGYAKGITVSGNYVFQASLFSGLQVIDVSNPKNPFQIADYCYSSLPNPNEVAYKNNYLYLTDSSEGLIIIDISDPKNPNKIGNFKTSGKAYGIKVIGDFAYITDRSSHPFYNQNAGLKIIDISDPLKPVRTGYYPTSDNANDIAISEDLAFIATGDDGLQIINISDSSNPYYTGSYDDLNNSISVEVKETRIYVGSGSGGIDIIDVSNPSNPVYSGFCLSSTIPESIKIERTFAYVAASESGLKVLDISTPKNPTIVKVYPTPGSSNSVDSYRNLVLVTYKSGFEILDTTNPFSPVPRSIYEIDDFSGIPYSISYKGSIENDYVYFAVSYSGLQIVDVSNPSISPIVAIYDTSSYEKDVSIAGSYAYIANGELGLRIIDISNPANPLFIGSCETSGFAQSIEISGNYAYLADGASGLQIIDITNPVVPILTGSITTNSSAFDVVIQKTYAYVATYNSGLQIVDISSPESPQPIGSVETTGSSFSINVSDHYLYLADAEAGLQIINIIDPTAPYIEKTFATSDRAYDIAVRGRYAYVADGDAGLTIIDLLGDE